MSNQLLFHIVVVVVLHFGIGTVNFALYKSAIQSTTLNWNNFNWTADKAVDGNSDGSNPDISMTCSSTEITIYQWVNNTWEVDIGPQIIVKTITVYGRTDGQDMLSGVKLYIGNVSGPWRYNQEIPSITSSMEKYVFKPNNAIASVISLMRFNSILVLCEVTVEGECLSGNFSEFCNLTCGKCFANQPCNQDNGTCLLGCDQGRKGTFCKEDCERGNYGYNCNETCGKCLYGNNSCSITDGKCSNGCIPGWQGDQCNTGCVPGKYGFNCNETCGNCLYGYKNCSISYGHCNNRCMAGWLGDDCKTECDAGTYGFHCNETCGYCLNGNNSCLHTYGQCDGGCQAGWKGETCKSECDAGTYGFHCNATCGYCLNGNNSCLHTYGQCRDGCQSGWKGETCKSGCERGTYGYNCNETCGHCLYGNNSCTTSEGNCTYGCIVEWQGYSCKRGTLGTVNTADVGPNAGVIVGSVLAAVGVSIFAMVIIIVIVKNRRKKDSKESSTDNVTTAPLYANLVVGNPACKITVCSREDRETAFSAIEESSPQRGMPIGATNSLSGVMEADVPVHNEYEKLRYVTESTESAYTTIDQNLIKTPT